MARPYLRRLSELPGWIGALAGTPVGARAHAQLGQRLAARVAASVVAKRGAIFLVDGCWLRNHRDVDFTNGAHHLTHRYVPPGELWVDREAPGAGELGFFVLHQLVHRAAMERGAGYLEALAHATRVERRQRRRARGLVGVRRVPASARERLRRAPLGLAGDTLLWLVDGRGVRDLYDPEFTLGGHDLRYRFVPAREIWIDDAVVPRERAAILIHEITERRLMARGHAYHEAHERASAVERRLRAELVAGGAGRALRVGATGAGARGRRAAPTDRTAPGRAPRAGRSRSTGRRPHG